jgi:hypothetical protein
VAVAGRPGRRRRRARVARFSGRRRGRTVDHSVLYEDDRVRVLDGRVAQGEIVPVHTHRWGGVPYILGTSDFVRRDPDGNVLADTGASKSAPVVGTAVWGAPLTPHTFENVGTEVFRTLTVEMKDVGAAHPA